ncbi:MAG TPA: cytochrome c oxidase assembly protein [Steroidobacteraceae bacterium]|nr:cytochrome c oxidase assembly protein [Steroidobacteraceae bacterium]
MSQAIPYCGLAPVPGELLTRFNLDPLLIAALAALLVWHWARASGRHGRYLAAAGWLSAAVAFTSPLCALSVALFSARVAQHMILVLVSAPLIAAAWPKGRSSRNVVRLWAATAAFFVALWFWHMPVPYDATFGSTLVYWSMHVTLFGTAIVLWRELLHHSAAQTAGVLAAGAVTSIHMGLLGAVLTFAAHPLFYAHLTTSWLWGLSALRDQQLGGVLMWVPGVGLFLFAALRSFGRLWRVLESEKAL